MRGLFILGNLAMKGFLIFGARRGKQQTLTLLEEWLAPVKTVSHEESLAALTRQYFTSHGPATLQDLMWWSGLTASEAKTGVEMVKTDLWQEVIDGVVYWRSPDSPGHSRHLPTTFLLQGYDEYVIAYKDRTAFFRPADLKRINAKNLVFFGPPVVIDGRIVGFWKRKIKKTEVSLSITPFRRLSKSEHRAVSAAAAHYARFLDVQIKLEPAVAR